MDSGEFFETTLEICKSLQNHLVDERSLLLNQEDLDEVEYLIGESRHNSEAIANECNDPHLALFHSRKYYELMKESFLDKEPSNDFRLLISYNEYGVALIMNKKWDHAIEVLLQCVRDMAHYSSISDVLMSLPYANLGLAYWLSGQTQMADKVLTQAIQERQEKFGEEDCRTFVYVAGANQNCTITDP